MWTESFSNWANNIRLHCMNKIASQVHTLVKQVYMVEIDESEFISELQQVNQSHHSPKNVGQAVQKGMRMVDAEESERNRIWGLTDEVDPDIKSGWDNWSDASDWDIG